MLIIDWFLLATNIAWLITYLLSQRLIYWQRKTIEIQEEIIKSTEEILSNILEQLENPNADKTNLNL